MSAAAPRTNFLLENRSVTLRTPISKNYCMSFDYRKSKFGSSWSSINPKILNTSDYATHSRLNDAVASRKNAALVADDRRD
jgi:hypothetical protein